ncbi:MAG TPA: AMP-binding protein [Armatimonadota bacterium]|jgi:long-chain-fatty-acid--[acyl-carrier-protein] ligase
MLNTILRTIVRALLWLRYRIDVRGLDAIAARGNQRILFLPSHPALIDPIIVMMTLHRQFAPRGVADEDAINIPGVRQLAERFGARTMPGMAKQGADSRTHIERVMAESIADLRRGQNVLLYPAGKILRSNREELGANSAVELILREAPDTRIVLLRTRGLWGSGFSAAAGSGEPHVGPLLLKGFFAILLNGIFFSPRRHVTLEFVEPADFPRTADRNVINRYLEAFYNAEPLPRNTYVPYSIWEFSGPVIRPEPAVRRFEGSVDTVPQATRQIVYHYLQKASGHASLKDESLLANDLGLDSLARAELIAWLEGEFGFPQGDVDSLRTVADVLLAATGETVAGGPAELRPISSAWFAPRSTQRVVVPEGATITDVFLHQAQRTPGRVIIADQVSGTKTFREVIIAVLALLPQVRQLPGERIGIMLPASVIANIVYLTVLFAGKTPVMLNWTVGRRNMRHGLEVTGVTRILTVQPLVSRIESQGTDMRDLAESLVYLDALAARISRTDKLCAALAGWLNWGALRRARTTDVAAILFTSGSENLPKAVPLTHTNLLVNLRDLLTVVHIQEENRLLGMLPPFHSFGLTGNMLLALCGGVPTMYHANPTEGAMLARLIAAYRASIAIGTPTFLNGILRAATPEQLESLRLAVTGAEECPPRVYALAAERCPQATIIEAYGITECSPGVAVNSVEAPKPHTIGHIMPTLHYALVNVESGRRVAPGNAGMLLLRGPSIFGGYLGEAPDPFVDFEGERWYRTGDLISEDIDGVLTFRGRLKRFIKLGGEMISLPAIEGVLQALFPPSDEDGPALAVLATANDERPELVLFTTKPLDRDTANGRIRDAGLSPLHYIRRVITLDAIPVLGTGKTDYRSLQAQLDEKNGAA